MFDQELLFFWCFEFNRSFIFCTGFLLHSHRGFSCSLSQLSLSKGGHVNEQKLSLLARHSLVYTGLFCLVVVKLIVRVYVAS